MDPYQANATSCSASVPVVVGQKITSTTVTADWSVADSSIEQMGSGCESTAIYAVYSAATGCRWTVTVESDWPAMCYTY